MATPPHSAHTLPEFFNATPHPEVNETLARLLEEAQAVLGSHIVGMYLYGSLSSGDFHPETSDIDFVIVTDEEVAARYFAELEAMHLRLAASGLKWARKLEGSYISRPALRRYNPADPPRPTLNEGRFYLDRHGSDWVLQRHIIREHGHAVFGPPAHTLIDPVLPDDLRAAVRGIMQAWWRPMLDDPSFLRSPEYHAFAVLSMCRTLHTLRHGEIATKPAAARWARKAYGRWRPLIDAALAWRPPQGWGQPAATLDFIRFTWEQCSRA